MRAFPPCSCPVDVDNKAQCSVSVLVKFHLLVLTQLLDITLENERCQTWPRPCSMAHLGVFWCPSLPGSLVPALDLAGPVQLSYPCTSPPNHSISPFATANSRLLQAYCVLALAAFKIKDLPYLKDHELFHRRATQPGKAYRNKSTLQNR